MNIMNKLKITLLTTLLVFILSQLSLACGAPQTVSGRIVADTPLEASLLLSRSIVVRLGDVTPDAQFDRFAHVNAFGFYYFADVTPCSRWTVEPRLSRKLSFLSIFVSPPSKVVFVIGDQPNLNLAVNFDLVIALPASEVKR